MSLKLVIDESGKKVAKNLSKEDLVGLRDNAVANGDISAINPIINAFTGIYEYNDNNPWWLKSDFYSSIWVLYFGDGKGLGEIVINWGEIHLSDDLTLASPKHRNLLNSLKFWITATDNPHENGGKLLKTPTVKRKVERVISLINALLLNGDSIELSEKHLALATDDFWMAICLNIANGGGVAEGIYDYSKRLKAILYKNIPSISVSEAKQFSEQYPYILRTLLDEEMYLGLSIDERVKACCWLEKVGYYTRPTAGSSTNYSPTGNTATITEIIYDGKIIPRQLNLPNLEELWIENPRKLTEFMSVPDFNSEEGISVNTITPYIECLKYINTNCLRAEVSQPPLNCTNNINTSRVSEHTTVKKIGRTKSLPPRFVFHLFRQCYEFSVEHIDAILNSVLNVSNNHNSICSKNNDINEIANLNMIDSTLIDAGVKTIDGIPPSELECFNRIRNNESLAELYNVLIGSLQILTGATLARRQDEFVALKSSGNLHPNINPYSEEGENTNYSLIFNAKKTGSGGKTTANAIIKRPIPRSIAKLIWKLEQFNIKIENHGLNNNKLNLFNSMDHALYKFNGTHARTYNTYLDSVCDYFESPLVEFPNGEFRRHYVRQHQLRRFFAMVFFWSRRFDGLDTLRWMLGHSDLRHLYHYISESELGGVINETKATVLLKGMKDRAKGLEVESIENIDKLEELISNRYGLNKKGGILISNINDAIDDYEDEDEYETIPHISQLINEQKIESEIIDMLEDKTITLEPNFVTVKNYQGESINTFTLVLKVKELI
ncbi:TPA: integrase [Vibrio parahaemolyticus]